MALEAQRHNAKPVIWEIRGMVIALRLLAARLTNTFPNARHDALADGSLDSQRGGIRGGTVFLVRAESFLEGSFTYRLSQA